MELFIFNPFRVVIPYIFLPGFTWGYSYSTPSGLFKHLKNEEILDCSK